MQPAVLLHQVKRTSARRHAFGRVRFLLPVLLSLILGLLAYQLPSRSRINVGLLGDQLFVASSEAQRAEQIEQGQWYADQLSPEGRGRWSRERGVLLLPGLGAGQDVQLTLYLAGWPTDVVREAPKQPEVRVLVGGQVVSSFTPTSQLDAYSVLIPSALRSSSAVSAMLEVSPTFTNTLAYADGRPKGIRLDAVEVATSGGARPDWFVIGGLAAATALALGITNKRSRRSWLSLLVGVGAALLGVTLLVIARPWLAAVLPAVLAGLAIVFAVINWRWFVGVLTGIRWRLRDSKALDVGLTASAVLVAGYILARMVLLREVVVIPEIEEQGTAERFFDTLIGLSLISAIVLALLVSVTLLPRWLLSLRRMLLTTRLAAVLLGLTAGVWLGYMTWLVMTLPFVGHADYADNAVVARNLLRGRGFVVDYVTQFYTLRSDASVTRPQETWPLLQPLLMASSMALFGTSSFGARLPNILFLGATTLLIFHIASRVWDRRVGLLAALLTLFNLLFFRLAIYATSDLALVVWSMAAFWLVFRAVENKESGTKDQIAQHGSWFSMLRSYWLWAGIFTGLMILQKPSSAIFALGVGLWALLRVSIGMGQLPLGQRFRRLVVEWVPPLALWTMVTVLVVSPYLVRNLLVFGKPFFSTEAYDAWILYFRGTRSEAWEDIYKIYTPILNGPGLPNRSWILQWGFDLTLGKIVQQAVDAWRFFAPPRGVLLNSGALDEFPYGSAGVWLMLLGLVTLRRRQRSIISLVLAALVSYTLFLILYWHTHDEPRYFVPFVPWLAMLAAWGACWLFDRIATVWRGRWVGLAGLAITATLVMAVQPHWQRIDRFLSPQSSDYWGRNWDAGLEAFDWIKQNTPSDAVIMTRVPWQLNYHADRAAVMTPNASKQDIMRIAKYYGADYLLMNTISTSLPEGKNGPLFGLARGKPEEGWELMYMVKNRYNGADVYVYRFPPDYDAVEDIVVGRE